jgi:hypothetical protein
MLVFALSTSTSGEIYLNIINNSSKDINLKITRYEWWDSDNEYTEEFLLEIGQNYSIKPYRAAKYFPTPDEYIIYFLIYNDDMEIIKEYNKKIDDEVFKYLFSDLERKRGKRFDVQYTLKITDELLK